MDRLAGMEVFVTVVEAGSMAAAAKRLDMTAQMIGKHIQFLEQRLGASVLIRTTRQQRLTEAGQQFYRSCKAILDQITAAERAMAMAGSETSGRLRITAPVTLGTTCLAPALVDFMALHPRLTIDLHLDDTIVDLVGGGFDAAIRVGALADSGLIARPLAAYRLLVCASPEYLARHGTPQTPADLVDHRTLDFAHWPRHGGWQFQVPRSSGLRMPESRLISNAGAALRVAALRGFGLIMQPELLLREDIQAGRLVPVLVDVLAPTMPVHVLFHKDRQQLPRVRSLVDFLVSRLSKSLG